jgi:hypothetical protein
MFNRLILDNVRLVYQITPLMTTLKCYQNDKILHFKSTFFKQRKKKHIFLQKNLLLQLFNYDTLTQTKKTYFNFFKNFT